MKFIKMIICGAAIAAVAALSATAQVAINMVPGTNTITALSTNTAASTVAFVGNQTSIGLFAAVTPTQLSTNAPGGTGTAVFTLAGSPFQTGPFFTTTNTLTVTYNTTNQATGFINVTPGVFTFWEINSIANTATNLVLSSMNATNANGQTPLFLYTKH